jgi:hypothetical protein
LLGATTWIWLPESQPSVKAVTPVAAG